MLGFAVGFLVVGLLLALADWRTVLAELAGADRRVYALGVCLVVGAILAWSEALRRLLSGDGPGPGDVRYRIAFLGGEFAKQALPLGHTAGPALMAYAVSRERERPYEETFAATTVTEFVNVGASILLATAGMAVLLSRRPGDPLLAALAGGLALAGAVLVSVGLLVVYRREALRRLVRALAAFAALTVGRVSTAAGEAVAPDRVDARFDAFYAAFDDVATDRRRLAAAGVFALVGWGCFVLPLATSFAALGYRLPIPLVLFAVPVVSLVNVVPLPGGLGGFELALITVVASLGGTDLAVGAAGVLLYRTATFGFVILAGGLAVAYLSLPLRERAG